MTNKYKNKETNEPKVQSNWVIFAINIAGLVGALALFFDEVSDIVLLN